MVAPKYSIIIATYNRIDELKELFDSVQAFDFQSSKFEMVIIDDGSNDGTEQYITSLKTDYNIVYKKQQNQGPGAARNLGMQTANGDYFLFIDSDCIIPADYLSKIDNHLAKNDLDAFGGPDTFHPSFSPLLKAINYSMTSFIGTGGTRGSKKSVAKFYPRSFNMGIKREVFEKIGGMGGLRHGQDMDFSARIYEAGFKVGLIHDAFVYHKRRTSLRKFFKQIFNWGVARINLSRLHENFLKPIHLAPAFCLLGFIFVFILSLFTVFGKWMFLLTLLAMDAIALFAFIQSFLTYKDIRVAFLSIITLYIQVFAYGAGTLSGIFQSLTGKKTAKGFTKNYYK